MSQHPAGADYAQIPQMRWRLAPKIMLSIGSVLVVLALIVTIMTFVQVRERAYADLELKATALADALNFTFEVLVSQDQATPLQRVAENSATIPGVRKIVIVDRNQQVLASSNRLDLDTTLTAGPLRDFIAQRTPQRMTSLTEQNELVIMQPLRGGRFGGQQDGDIVGAIQVIVDTSGAQATARTTALQYLGVTLGSYLLLSLILAVILRMLVVGPVQQLAAAAQSFREGRRSQRSQLRRRDELGLLAATFDAMAEEVVQLVSGLEAQVAARTVALEQERTHLAMTLADLAEERALLAQRVEERTADLRAANAELARAARLKDEFLASMSHELRTPLNTILGMAESLEEGIYGALGQEQTTALRHVSESGRHLLALINDILDLSKIEAGQLTLSVEDVEIAQVCQASVRFVASAAAGKRLDISLHIDGAVTVLQADARRLKQMLVNLLSNAVKFTPEGGAIGLEVVGDAATQSVHLAVWDTGIGIAADDVPRLFQSFVQLDSRLARQYAGTGLGLALVHRMAVLHGGSIRVKSAFGQGSRFTLTLPWRAPTPLAAASERTTLPTQAASASSELIPPAHPGAPGSQPHPPAPIILVVDDDEQNLATVTPYLAAKAYRVVVARNGIEALARIHDATPALVLMDIQMPGMDGLEAIRRIRADAMGAAIPIIALTALAMAGDRERCLAAGADDYLSKPVRLKDLVAVIDAYLYASDHTHDERYETHEHDTAGR
jgi:signal transduction histidine kinase/CheY-like chemotaxis protein